MICWNASPTSRSGARDARTLGVRRVAEHEVDALGAELGEAADIRAQAVHRRMVELPVAGVQDAAGRRLQDDGDGVGDRVRDADEADPEAADLHRILLRPGLFQLDRVQGPCSSSRDWARPSVSRVPQTSGTGISRSR